MTKLSGACSQFRNTKQKSIILDVIRALKGRHFTVDDIMDILKSKNISIGRATVYRFIKQLEDMGEIRKYHISENSSACFEYIGDGSQCKNHCHAMCSICGRVLHIQNELLDSFAEKIKEQDDFEIDDSRTVFYGICSNCKKKKG